MKWFDKLMVAMLWIGVTTLATVGNKQWIDLLWWLRR